MRLRARLSTRLRLQWRRLHRQCSTQTAVSVCSGERRSSQPETRWRRCEVHVNPTTIRAAITPRKATPRELWKSPLQRASASCKNGGGAVSSCTCGSGYPAGALRPSLSSQRGLQPPACADSARRCAAGCQSTHERPPMHRPTLAPLGSTRMNRACTQPILTSIVLRKMRISEAAQQQQHAHWAASHVQPAAAARTKSKWRTVYGVEVGKFGRNHLRQAVVLHPGRVDPGLRVLAISGLASVGTTQSESGNPLLRCRAPSPPVRATP